MAQLIGRSNSIQTQEIEEYITVDDGSPDTNLESINADAERSEIENLNYSKPNRAWNSRGSFIDGLAVGLGAGIIASFAILWASLFFGPLLPEATTYESLLASFIYPLYFLLGLGLVTLTAGIIREYYSKTKL